MDVELSVLGSTSSCAQKLVDGRCQVPSSVALVDLAFRLYFALCIYVFYEIYVLQKNILRDILFKYRNLDTFEIYCSCIKELNCSRRRTFSSLREIPITSVKLNIKKRHLKIKYFEMYSEFENQNFPNF